MAPINQNPDELYQRSREDLLLYEDSRFNSLIQAVANFYTTRNDQSTWGNFLRALAIELARLEYAYAYDIVGKDPHFLTPPDIRRRWNDPLYVSSNWPSKTQFDTDFKTMLIDLIAAYRQGSTPKSIHDVIFAYTGKNIVVEELYKEIGVFFDQSDRNSIKVSVNVGGNDPLSDIQNLNQLQQITQSLYGAIDLAKPAHVGLEFTTIFGEGENLDCSLSPKYLTQQMFEVVGPTMQSYYSLYAYVLINPPLFWTKNTKYALNTVINSQPIVGSPPAPLTIDGVPVYFAQIVTTPGVSGSVQPSWNPSGGGTTLDGSVVWTNIVALPPSQISIEAFDSSLGYGFVPYGLLYGGEESGSPPISYLTSAQVQALYQPYYLNSNCTGTGIDDTLIITFRQEEQPPFDPMLLIAPVIELEPDPGDLYEAYEGEDPSVKTTIAAYGRKLSPTLSPSAWGSLPSIMFDIVQTSSDGVNATYSWTYSGSLMYPLVDGELVTITGCSRAAFNVTAVIKDVITTGMSGTFHIPLAAIYPPASESASPPFATGVVTPTLQAGYYPYAGVYVLGALPPNPNPAVGDNWYANTQFFAGQMITDSNGNIELALNNGVSGGSQPVSWNATQNGSTNDGSVVWRNIGKNPITPSSKWIQIMNLSAPTGEVANWDESHPFGLLAPRLDQVWEISGGDSDVEIEYT